MQYKCYCAEIKNVNHITVGLSKSKFKIDKNST